MHLEIEAHNRCTSLVVRSEAEKLFLLRLTRRFSLSHSAFYGFLSGLIDAKAKT